MPDDACSGVVAPTQSGDAVLAVECPEHGVKRFRGDDLMELVQSADRWLGRNGLEARIIDKT